MSSLAAIKAVSQSRALEEQSNCDRQRDILVLILSHLQSHGYTDTATSLLRETRESLSRFEVADNVDLSRVLKEYEEQCRVKFGRRPVFCRQTTNNQGTSPTLRNSSTENGSTKKHAPRRKRQTGNLFDRYSHRETPTKGHTMLTPLSTNHATPGSNSKPVRSRKRAFPEDDTSDDVDRGITGFALNSSPAKTSNDIPAQQEMEPRQLKPLPDFDGDSELRSLAMTVRRDIVDASPRVAWDDIVGLNAAKQTLKEAILLPRLYPELFTGGLRSPWKSALLYGMPGTGKTLLAKAVATESDATFFNISASSIVSKFRGESEKLIRMLFDLARHYAPSTIFLDECDSIMGSRGSGASGSESSEHEGSRRMKTELLVQLDGLVANNSDVFLLAASNLPWDLDAAFLRRLEKRISIPLPNAECRKHMIRSHRSEFSQVFRKDELLEQAAEMVDEYSGSDLKALCKEAAMKPLRRVVREMDTSSDHDSLSLLMKRNPVTFQDFQSAVAAVNHSTSSKLQARHKQWEASHGAA
ncbi:hypothetical protein ACHAXT_013111 [Thalassiosira profunda]